MAPFLCFPSGYTAVGQYLFQGRNLHSHYYLGLIFLDYSPCGNLPPYIHDIKQIRPLFISSFMSVCTLANCHDLQIPPGRSVLRLFVSAKQSVSETKK